MRKHEILMAAYFVAAMVVCLTSFALYELLITRPDQATKLKEARDRIALQDIEIESLKRENEALKADWIKKARTGRREYKQRA